MIRFWAVVPAAGAGRRLGGPIPKQYLELAGRRVIEHTLQRLLDHPRIAGVFVALSPGDEYWPTCAFADHPRVFRATGGAERSDSVLNALRAMTTQVDPDDWVLVHDAARPCLSADDLDRLIGELESHPVGGLLGVPVHDTVKRAGPEGTVVATVPRQALWRAFTPQMFRHRPLLDALERAAALGQPITDDASAMELAGHRPRMVEGRPDNIKITRPEDLALAEFFLRRQAIDSP